MRDSLTIEVRVRRFDLWRLAVAVVAVAAIATLVAWATTSALASDDGATLRLAIAAILGAATVAAAASLAGTQPGVLACRDGVWSFAPERGGVASGPLAVALDLGGFLLLRIGSGVRARLWLPVQKRGLEHDWHALRCAVYSPPPRAGAAGAAGDAPPR